MERINEREGSAFPCLSIGVLASSHGTEQSQHLEICHHFTYAIQVIHTSHSIRTSRGTTCCTGILPRSFYGQLAYTAAPGTPCKFRTKRKRLLFSARKSSLLLSILLRAVRPRLAQSVYRMKNFMTFLPAGFSRVRKRTSPNRSNGLIPNREPRTASLIDEVLARLSAPIMYCRTSLSLIPRPQHTVGRLFTPADGGRR